MSDTPIYDQLVIDRAITDPEGVALVEAIRKRLTDRADPTGILERRAALAADAAEASNVQAQEAARTARLEALTGPQGNPGGWWVGGVRPVRELFTWLVS